MISAHRPELTDNIFSPWSLDSPHYVIRKHGKAHQSRDW
jgi:hypothetical protein